MTETFTPSAEELLGYNANQATNFDDAALQVSPTRHLAVVACMDSRIDTFKVLVHHTDCGLQKVNKHDFRTQLEDELGVKPWWSL